MFPEVVKPGTAGSVGSLRVWEFGGLGVVEEWSGSFMEFFSLFKFVQPCFNLVFLSLYNGWMRRAGGGPKSEVRSPKYEVRDWMGHIITFRGFEFL